ncbi:MAG: lactate utilization protein [Anaerolineae bacterium]
MTSSRDKILNKLKDARRPFPAAPPRPRQYLPVTSIADTSPEGLLERFTEELTRLKGEVFVVNGDDEARDCVLGLLESHNARRIASWHYKYIPVDKLYTAIQAGGYVVDYAHIKVEDDLRRAELERLESAEVGLTGVDAVAATTGTLIVSTGEGKSRIPSLLPPVHIAVVTLDQFVPRVEDWLARVRASGNAVLHDSANITFISGPSRTADIEKQLVLGVHGPKQVQVVVKR